MESPAKIRRAARYIVGAKQRGEDPVIVVSAPGRATDHFLRWARRVSDHPDERELDMLLSVGERMAMSLLAMAINAEGRYRAVSFTGSQVGIITDTRHTDASIIEVKGYRIRECIAQGRIPIVAGFQGISTEKEITTLGRGGSDATAVALAAAVGADRCELIKESGGIFSADPLLAPAARLLPEMDYVTLEAVTVAGAKVVQPRAAALAREHRVVLRVNAPDGRRGTLVSDRALSGAAIAAITLRPGLRIQTSPAGSTALESLIEEEMFAWAPGSALFLNGGTGEGSPTDVATLVGWGGRLPPTAVHCGIRALKEADLPLLGALRSGGSLACALAAGSGRRGLTALHAAALEAGLIEGLTAEADEAS